MGSYIVQADIENVFGTENVAVWSNLESEDATANTARIATAIATAEAEVEARFRQSLYAIPFSAAGSGGLSPVVDWCAKLAGVWLYSSRGQRGRRSEDNDNAVMFHRRAALEEMDTHLAGMRTLNCTRKSLVSSAPFIV